MTEVPSNPEKPAPAKPRRLGLYIPIAIFVALVAGWTIWWHAIKDQTLAHINAVLESERAAGAGIDATIARAWGFPLELAIDLENVAYTPPDKAWRMTTPHLRVNVSLTNPRHVIVEAPQALAFAYRGGVTTTLRGEQLRLSLRFNDGGLTDASFGGENIVYADPNPEGRAFTADNLVANLRRAPNAEGEHQVSIDIASLALERPVHDFGGFGLAVADVNLRLRINRLDALFAFPHSDPFESWRRAGGIAHIDGARLNWGPLRLTAQGEASLDATRRPQGQTRIVVENAPEALRALNRPSGEAKLESQLTAQNGVLRLAPDTTLGELSPLY